MFHLHDRSSLPLLLLKALFLMFIHDVVFLVKAFEWAGIDIDTRRKAVRDRPSVQFLLGAGGASGWPVSLRCRTWRLGAGIVGRSAILAKLLMVPADGGGLK